ncbi:unnamed protein product [Phytomonas sp. EM1]|nr:unnamed protein product [Phytomonas sp. EM1]|eukprot:CCW63635.1 unnamed protein product [Phytomonas sp. isolate EM1]
MVDKCQTFSSGLQSKLLEQELQEQLARAYYLLVAQETSYANHTLSVERLVSNLQIIAERVKAFHAGNDPSSPAALVSDAKGTHKNSENVEKDTHIVDDKDVPFRCMEQDPHHYCAVEREMSESYDLKQDTYQNEGYNFDGRETRVHITGKVSTPTLDSHVESRLPNTSFYACSATSFCADARNPSLVMGEIHDSSIKARNDITTVSTTEVSLTAPYFNVGHEAQVPEKYRQEKQGPHRCPSTTTFIETIHSLITGGDGCSEIGVDHVVSVGDCRSRGYFLISETEHRRLETAPPQLSLSCPANQLEEAEGGMTNTTKMTSAADHIHYNRPLGLSCNVTSSGNIGTCSTTEALHLQFTEDARPFARGTESGAEDNKNPASVDQSCECKLGNPSQHPRQFFSKNSNTCDSTTLMPFVQPEAWDHTDLRHLPSKGAVMKEPQGLSDLFPFATDTCMTQSKAAIPIHRESRCSFSAASKAVPGASQGKLSVSDITPQFVFWPGLQVSNLFLPIEIATRLDDGAPDVSSTLSLALPLREKDLKAIIEARFPPYLTQLTPDRVHAFHDALRESLFAARTSSGGGSTSVLALQEEEEAWVGCGPDLWRRAAEVAAALLTLLSPVLQGLQGAASIPLDGLLVPNEALLDIIDITIEAKEGLHRRSSDRGVLDVGSVKRWRRYWCRRLYALLHEARCGLEVVCEFDTRWPSTLHRLTEKQHHMVELTRPSSSDFSFPTPTHIPSSGSTVPVAFKPECSCMEAAVQISGFDSESCRVFLHDLGAPNCFSSLLLALTEDDNDGGGWASRTDGSKSESQMICIGTGVTTLEELPPSCPGWPLPIEHGLDPNEHNVVVKVQMPPCVVVESLQIDLVYLDSLL